MQPVDRFGLESHEGPYQGWPTTSRLRVDGVFVYTRVPGYLIEAQYACEAGFLIVTSFDCPFEESNAFVLLDRAYRVLAKRELLAPYATFLLDAHWPVDPETIALHYQETLFYTLRVVRPGPLPWQRHRLALRRTLAWERDARMQASHARLMADLAAIRSGLDGAGSEARPPSD